MTAGRGLQGKVPSAGGAQRNRVGWGLVRLLPLTDAPPNSLWASSEGEIVDGETLQSTPLTEIYDHHWILLNNVHKNRLCKGIEYVFGVGAESRNTPFDLPAGYGYPVAEGTEWGANIHLLRTEGLEGEDPYLAVKHCNECFYAPGKGDACNIQSNGTFQCCGDPCALGKIGKQSCKCPTAKGVSTERKGYKLKYTLNYTTGCDLEPVDIGVLAAPDCAAFYHVQRNNAEPVTVASAELSIDGVYDVVAATGHQHVGAVNLSVSVNGRLVCASYPTYGNQKGVAGDELGYLTHISQCIGTEADAYTEGPLQLSKGDKLRVDGYYFVGDNDERIAPYKGGTHLNVMSYLYTAFAARGSKRTAVIAAPRAKQANSSAGVL